MVLLCHRRFYAILSGFFLENLIPLWPSVFFTQNSGILGDMLGLYAIVESEAKLLAEVPEGTKRKAFHHHFDKDYAQVILRIRDNDPANNPSAVIYEITLGQ